MARRSTSSAPETDARRALAPSPCVDFSPALHLFQAATGETGRVSGAVVSRRNPFARTETVKPEKHPKKQQDKKREKNDLKGTIDLVSLQQKYVLNEQADSKLKMYNFNDYLKMLLWMKRFKRKLTNG